MDLTLYDTNGDVVETTTSGPDGTYVFAGYTAAAGYTVQVSPPAGQIAQGSTMRPVDLTTTDATEVDFVVRAIIPVAVSGTVRDADGTPVAGVEVTITSDDGLVSQTVTTGVDGSYIADTVPVGGHTVTVTPPGEYTAVTAPRAITVASGTQTPITDQDFVLALNPSLSGTVTAGGDPAPGITLVATGPGGDQRVAVTAADGTYTFPTLPGGGWTVTVLPPEGYLPDGPLLQTVTLGTQDVDDVDFALLRTGELGGVVLDDAGAPVPGVALVVTDLGGTAAPVTLTTGPDGGYAVAELLPGVYRVDVVVPDGYTLSGPGQRTVTITADGEVVVGQDFLLVRDEVVVPPVVTPPVVTPPVVAPPVVAPPVPGPVPPALGGAAAPRTDLPRPGYGTSTDRLSQTGASTTPLVATAGLLLAAGALALGVARRAPTGRTR